ncbi:hypothetical protein B4158_5722 [Bacillus cereus]|nr:hypothetical protein B4158_5722 [Bacillus cereus]
MFLFEFLTTAYQLKQKHSFEVRLFPQPSSINQDYINFVEEKHFHSI